MINKYAQSLSDRFKQNSGQATSGGISNKFRQTQPERGHARSISQTTQTSQRPTDEEKKQVILMQTLLSALGVALASNKEQISQSTGLSVSDLQMISGIITDTGGQQSHDGKWGQKTVRSLSEVSKIAKKIGQQNINPGKDYLTVHPDNVISAAKENIDQIAKLMKSLGLGAEIPQNVGVSVRPDFYDKIPTILSPSNWNDFTEDGVALRPADLDNIWKFYDFITSQDINLFSRANREDVLTKTAKIIQDANIIKLGQSVTGPQEHQTKSVQDGSIAGNAEGAGKELYESRQAFSSMTAQKFNAYMNWFAKRARNMYQNVSDAFTSGETQEFQGKEVPVVSKEQFNTAKEYHDAIMRLYENWNAQKHKFDDTSHLSRSDLKMWPKDKVPQQKTDEGHGRSIEENNTANKSEYKPQEGIFYQFPHGPIQPIIDLNNLYEYVYREQKNAAILTNNLARDDIGIQDFRRMYPGLLVDAYRMDPNKNARAFAIMIPYALAAVLKDVYSTWRSQAITILPSLPEDMQKQVQSTIDRQRSMLESWMSVLSRLKSDAERWHPGKTNTLQDL